MREKIATYYLTDTQLKKAKIYLDKRDFVIYIDFS